jgi:hypothetical protein
VWLRPCLPPLRAVPGSRAGEGGARAAGWEVCGVPQAQIAKIIGQLRGWQSQATALWPEMQGATSAIRVAPRPPNPLLCGSVATTENRFLEQRRTLNVATSPPSGNARSKGARYPLCGAPALQKRSFNGPL